MGERWLSSKIHCFNPAKEKKSRVNNRVVFHYTSPEALMSILQSTHLRFTDCQFLNDKSEYTHIHIPLKQAFEEIKDSLHDDYMSGLIQEYLDHGYQYSELIQEKPDVGFKGLRMYEMRYYVFCTSLDNDLLNMWNYYVKGGNYQGYNIGISVKDIINSFSNITDEKVNIYFGPIIYTDREKIELLKRIILDIDQKLSRALEKITDIQERGITTDIHYGELLSYIQNYRLFFKDGSFSGEKEYRFVIKMPAAQQKHSSNTPQVNYSIRQGVITPHCDVRFEKEGVIKKITLAPMMDHELAKVGLERYLHDQGYKKEIIIDNSNIPIRY